MFNKFLSGQGLAGKICPVFSSLQQCELRRKIGSTVEYSSLHAWGWIEPTRQLKHNEAILEHIVT